MGEWQTANEVIVRLFERKQSVLASFTVARQWPCSLFKPPELQIRASIPSIGSVMALHVKILGTEQILHAWWRLMSQEEPWSGRLNVILQPRALPRASGTAFQSFVAHIMPPSPVPCHHINNVGTILPRVLQMDEYVWRDEGNHGFRITLQFLVYQNTALFSSVCPPSWSDISSFLDNLMV